MPERKEVPSRASGGKATAAKMTPEQRKARAQAGAMARWGSKPAAIAKDAAPSVGMSAGMALARAKAAEKPVNAPKFAPPVLPPGVVPAGEKAAIAMDYAPGTYDFANSAWGMSSYFQPFPGYPYLAGLATRAEYRAFADSLSSELTREWIKFKGASDTEGDGEAEQDKVRIRQLEEAVKAHNLQDLFKLASTHDCFFGRGQIVVNIDDAQDDLPLVLSPKTVKKGSLRGFSVVEAMWTTPSAYNSNDPTAPDFYKPREWFVLGKRVHASRVLTIITRPLPDMLKPAYNFSGISLSQLAEPYVNNWLRTRQSVADLVNNFSITALKTNMAQTLQGNSDGSDVFARADLFTLTRSNRGLMLLDKDAEELVQVNTPLSGLHELQAQALEQLCTVSRIPAVILTGVSPSGLNASSDGEIRVFYDWVSATQNAFYRHPLEICIKLIMLDIWGEIDDSITFDFNSLWQTSAKEESEIRTANANAATAYIDRGVLSPEEVRESLAADPNSGFSGIDVSQVPEVPEAEPIDPLAPEFQPVDDESVSPAQHRAMEAAAHGKSTLGIPKKVGEEFVAKDSEWKEGDHPRAENGQFGSGTASHEQRAGVAAEIKERKESLAGLKRHLKKLDGQILAGHPAIVAMEDDIKALGGLIDRYNTRGRLQKMAPDDINIIRNLQEDYAELERLAKKHGTKNA